MSEAKLLVVIQARSNSKRFNNKVMHLIYNKPLIWHVVSRIKKAKKIKKVVVASSVNKTDNKLVNYLRKNRINYFRGELNNVAKRMFNVAQKYKASFFMRISGDSPLIDHKIIDRAISIFHNNKKKYDLITNVYPRTFSKGQSVEIIKTATLGKVLKFLIKKEKEHVTSYFYKNSNNFSIKNFIYIGNKRKTKLSVDTKKDLDKILKFFK